MLRRGVTCCGAEKDAAARRKMLRRGVGHTAAQKDAAARREIAAMRREIAAMRRGNAALQQVAFKSPGDARRKGQERAPVAGPPSRG